MSTEYETIDHPARRRLLYAAVAVMEPYACGRLIQHYVACRDGKVLPLLRIYVDLERMVRTGHLVRHIRPRLGGDGTNFFWETLAAVLVEPEHSPLRSLSAQAALTATGRGDLTVATHSRANRMHPAMMGLSSRFGARP